jgi:hypothetical protein
MTQLVQPQPEFVGLTEAEIMTALQDHDPSNPVACEVARLIAGYTENFRAHVERLGRIPEEILHVRPGSPIEAVAMRLTTEAITDTLSRRP